MIPEHMLLPNPKNPLQFRKFPLPQLPFVAVLTVEIHVVELKDHRQLPAIFSDILACLELCHATGHFSDSAAVVLAKNFDVHFVEIFMDIWAVFS